MANDRLNKLNSGAYKYNNPYAIKAEEPPKDKPAPRQTYGGLKPEQPVFDKEKSIIEQNGYLLGKLLELERGLDAIRYDIVTLLQVLDGVLPIMTAAAVRERYYAFRADQSHVMQRIANKTESVTKNELKINDGE
jgi:hypothetical protein